jgi:hypothetical protein
MSVLLISLCTIAQEAPARIHEIGLTLSNLDNFGVRYKIGNEKTLLRMTFLTINGTHLNTSQDSEDYYENGSLGFGFNIGFEKRNPIAEKMFFYYGLDAITSYSHQKSELVQTGGKTTSSTIAPGVGFVLGLNYSISSRFNISAELVPSLIYSYTKSTTISNGVETEMINKSFSYGIGNSGASLTLSFRFGKKE